MILASHQPNFFPYMGYLYKMYMCDVFTISDEVQFTRNVHHNYNFIDNGGSKLRLTVPIEKHLIQFNQVRLSNWPYHKWKVLKTIECCYRKYLHFDEAFPEIELILTRDYETLCELNEHIVWMLNRRFGMNRVLIKESFLGLDNEDPNDDILRMCEELGADRYLSGSGAKDYINEDLFAQNGVKVIWTGYKPLDYGSPIDNLSCIDYIMRKGFVIPEEWITEREVLHGV